MASQREQARQQDRDADGGQHQQRGVQVKRRWREPARRQRGQLAYRQDRPAQVVEHLHAAHGRHRMASGMASEDPAEELPVAARPAVLPLGGHVMARGKLLHDLDIRRQARPREHAFEQVVTEHGVIGDAAGQCGLEGVDVIDALADVRTFVEQVLIDIRSRGGIGIDAAWRGKDPLEQRPFPTHRQRRRHPRLEDRIATSDPLQRGVEPGPVQRMRDLADQPQCGVSRQARVRVQRNDIADVRRYVRRYAAHRHMARVGGTPQQAVQLVQLAALALPPHPDALARIEDAAPMKQEEAVSGWPWAMALVQ
ncbi:hypothetical protein D3C72_884900 [compost metagenome]